VNAKHHELDWPGALKLVGRFCATERGLERILATSPSGEKSEVERRLGITRDILSRRALRPPIVLGGLDEGAPLLARLGPAGRALPAEDLLDLFALVERAESARAAVPVEGIELSALGALLIPLASFEDLLGERDVTFEPDGRIKDTATTRLYAIRSAILRLRREVVRRLEEFARGRPEALSEGYVTEKGGRYCLPVRADHREAVAGIVHEKSGSGQTLFVEPLAVVDANNGLAEALEEEREEVHRILVALTGRFSARRADLAAAVEVLTELDAYQARAEFSSRTNGIFPAFGDRLVLKAARHPLLDRRLAALREEVFGEDAEKRHSDAVPLDLEMPAGTRVLLLSGPNAGGKSVAMKTAGLFSLLAQSGFALPAGAGTTLPIFDQVLVVAGDSQDLLGDLSSFAAAMTKTARVLATATARSLVLLDELGSGTDPDEGAAIAIAVLDHDRERGGLTIATTHLSSVKEWGHAEEDVLSAAMEFDEAKGRPTFRIRPGATGRSRALAVAEKAGIPAAALAAARKRLGTHWAAADAALERLEHESRRASEEAARARALAEKAESRLLEVEGERAALAAERVRLREKARAEIDRALEALRERTRRELDRLREELKAGRSISRGALTTITHAAREEALELFADEQVATGPVAVGDRVRVLPFKTTGTLVSVDEAKGEAEVEVGGKRMRVARASLTPAGGSAAPKKAAKPPRAGLAASVPGGEPQTVPTAEIVLVGQRVDAALAEVERAINEARLQGKGALRIVHGHGTGRLGAAVREFLRDHPGVASQRPGDEREGGNAVTMARLDT
jgi:DNA mismatch repair protein MutS2